MNANFVFLFLLAVLPPAAFAALDAASVPSQLRLASLSGTVDVKKAGQKLPKKAEPYSYLSEGDELITGQNGRAELLASNGSLIEVEPLSTFGAERLTEWSSGFSLFSGYILATINKLRQDQSWQVQTPEAVVAVRGTELAVAQDQSAKVARAGVFNEGKVTVSSKSGQAVTLLPRQETSVPQGRAPAPAHALRYFRLASARMAMLKKRQQYFMKLFLKKYRIHPQPQ